jgi:hypothetical protein
MKKQQTHSRQPQHQQVNEGLRYADLRETILTEISIDLFQPKGGREEDIIVVAFECIDEPPAKDLEEFIRTGPIDTLDSDISPGPTEDGNYVVFCEFERDNKFPVKFVRLLNDIQHVVSNNKWKFKSFPNKKSVDLSPDALLSEVLLDPTEYSNTKNMHDRQEAAESFFHKDLARPHYISEGKLHIKLSQRAPLMFFIEAIDSVDNLFETEQLKNKPIKYDNPRILRLTKLFGPSYNVNSIGKYVVVTNSHGNAMALKPDTVSA